MKSKYMEFDKIGDTGKTEVWNIISKSSYFNLGMIKWYGPWRQYCFFPARYSVWSVDCLENIREYLGELNSLRKAQEKQPDFSLDRGVGIGYLGSTC